MSFWLFLFLLILGICTGMFKVLSLFGDTGKRAIKVLDNGTRVLYAGSVRASTKATRYMLEGGSEDLEYIERFKKEKPDIYAIMMGEEDW